MSERSQVQVLKTASCVKNRARLHTIHLNDGTPFRPSVCGSFSASGCPLFFLVNLSSCRLWDPTSVSFVQNVVNGDRSSLLAITEGSQLTMWDLRVKENGGCVHRISGTPGDTLYSVCSSSTGNIAVGGVDRTVTIYDPRRWSSLSRWVHCSKFEITGLAFSTVDPDYIYIQGVDYEVFCGQWKERNKLFSFRGDSNWLGFSKCSNKDVLGGWCDSGSIFVVDVA